jgi:hypothetical protein
VIGGLLAGVFLAVVLAFACTEYLLLRFDVRRCILLGRGSPLFLVLGSNCGSFLLVWLSAMVFVFASGSGAYEHATIVCLCAQAVWFAQHMWSYYRDHLRLHYQ